VVKVSGRKVLFYSFLRLYVKQLLYQKLRYFLCLELVFNELSIVKATVEQKRGEVADQQVGKAVCRLLFSQQKVDGRN
jgi:hypothetical protein